VAYVSSSSNQGIRAEKFTQRLSWSNMPPKGTWNSLDESWPLWCFRYICSAQQLRNEYYRDPALPILLGDEALAMGLLFKLLAQGRNVAAIETCARGIEAMAREEAAFLAGDGLLTIGFRRQARTTSYSDNMFKEENENASTIYGHYRTRR
jgi:hypothetical protein